MIDQDKTQPTATFTKHDKYLLLLNDSQKGQKVTHLLITVDFNLNINNIKQLLT